MTKFEIFEKCVLWVGAVLAIVVSGFTIHNEFSKLEPPNLSVSFALTNSEDLIFSPYVKSSDSDWSDSFPIGLRIVNNGEKTAKNVKLNLIHAPNLQIKSSTKELNYKRIFNPPVTLIMTGIPLGNIDPGQKVHLDDELDGVVENIVKIVVPVEFADKVKANIPVSLVATFDIDARLSAENVSEKNSHLYLTIGLTDQLKKNKKTFFEVIENKVLMHEFPPAN